MNIIKTATFLKSVSDFTGYKGFNVPEIIIVGRSNVGKSSIINMLANNKKLAKVSATQGKTKLANFFMFNNEFVLVDLPGYGYAEENQKSSSSNPQGYSNSLDMEEESSFDPSADTTKIKILAGIVAVVVVALALLIIMLIKPGGIQDNTGVDVSGETAAPVVTPEAGTSFVQGDNNYADSENNQPAGTLSSPAEYVKGLEGEESAC